MNEHLTKIVWRDWYSEGAIATMTAMKTLPREETEIDARFMDGEDVAADLVRLANENEGECYREGGKITILEPAEFAGNYDVAVDYEPSFSAYKENV